MAFAFMGAIMASCSAEKTYSLEEAAGFATSEISSIQASGSVYQSLAWLLPKEVYPYLDCRFIQVDFDINAAYFSTWPPSELKDDAYVLRVGTPALEASGQGGMLFIVSHSTKHMYFDGLTGTYRSKDAMPSEFVDFIAK